MCERESIFCITDHTLTITLPISEWTGDEEFDEITEKMEFDSSSDDVYHHLTHTPYDTSRLWEGRCKYHD